MKHIKAQRHFLYLLVSCEAVQRRALLTTASETQVRVIGEICLNLLRGAVPVTTRDKTTLSTHAPLIRRITNKTNTDAYRRRLLVANSDTVAVILKPVLKHILA